MLNSFNSQCDQLQSEWDVSTFGAQAIATLGFGDIDEQSELTGYELIEETEQLRAEWAGMSAKGRAKLWERFTQDVDEGGAGRVPGRGVAQG